MSIPNLQIGKIAPKRPFWGLGLGEVFGQGLGLGEVFGQGLSYLQTSPKPLKIPILCHFPGLWVVL